VAIVEAKALSSAAHRFESSRSRNVTLAAETIFAEEKAWATQ
jgi:hypothetical protein